MAACVAVNVFAFYSSRVSLILTGIYIHICRFLDYVSHFQALACFSIDLDGKVKGRLTFCRTACLPLIPKLACLLNSYNISGDRTFSLLLLISD